MENVLIRLKKILNTYTDKELEEMELWIENNARVHLIAIDDEAICLVTDTKNLKINGLDW